MRLNLRREDGFTLVEMSIAGIVAAILLAALGTFLMNSVSGGAFTQGMSSTIDDVRIVMQQIEKETRGADTIAWCEPTGSCLEVGAQTPTGSFQTLRYNHTGETLTRQTFNESTAEWSEPLVTVDRVVNAASQPVFSCDSDTSYLRLTVDLHIEPTPNSNPTFNVQTSIRPRNFLSAAVCQEGT